MKKSVLILILFTCLFSSQIYSQENLVGKKEIYGNENGTIKQKTVYTPEVNHGKVYPQIMGSHPQFVNSRISMLRWSTSDPTAIGGNCVTSGDGLLNATGWNLNSERLSLYNNTSSTPLWESPADPSTGNLPLVMSDDGSRIAGAMYHNVRVFNSGSATPVFDFDLTTLPDTGIASAVDITSDGQFIICSASRSDSSTIFGFNTSSTTPVWSFRIVPATGSPAVYGIRMSGNDSVTIVNTYGEFLVFNTYTGALLHRDVINPLSTSGTQSSQGISGDGSIIATINYRGYVRVFEWTGAAYSLLWQHQEPPGTFYNWMYSVDITDDGDYIACGTLNFLSSSSYDGKVKVFSTTGGNTPLWTFTGCGDAVLSVSFSKSGNILSAASYGPFTHTSSDLYVFKTFLGNVPIYSVNTPGSFFSASTSDDGQTVVASGKAIHARSFGNGGLSYNVAIDTNDIPTSIITSTGIADNYRLAQNYPNPFNPSTNIRFDLPENGFVKLTIFDALGKEVKTLLNNEMSAGSYEINWNAERHNSGVYFYRIETGQFTQTKKMLMIK